MINGSEIDRHPLCVRGSTVDHCSKYCYLGAWFTADGDMKSVLKIHETSMSPSVNKFSMFCSINTSMPFPYKLKVFKAALTTSLIYSAESWITPNIKGIEKVYNKMVRILLGVRGNTPIQLCLAEIGLNTVTYEIGKNNIDLENPFIWYLTYADLITPQDIDS